MSKHSQRPVFDDRPKGLPPKHRPKHNSRETPTGNLVGRNINPRDLLEDGDDDDDLGGDDDPLTFHPHVPEETDEEREAREAAEAADELRWRERMMGDEDYGYYFLDSLMTDFGEETASPMISLHKDPNTDSPNTPTQG